MKLDIINLIDNFKKFDNYAINPNPMQSHRPGYNGGSYWLDFLNNTQNCLIFEHKPVAAIKLFNILLEKGKHGIVITRNHPDKFGSSLVSNEIEMYWLSTEDYDYVIHPWNINSLINIVNDFIKKDNQGIILLNGLEYLSTYNDNNIIFNLVSDISRILKNTFGKFFITIDPVAIGNQFLVTIEKNSEIITQHINHPIKEMLA